MGNTVSGFNQQQWHLRLGGGLYLAIIVIGIVVQVAVRGQLVVAQDLAATADNILAHQSLFRAGLVAELLMLVFDLALAVIFYGLLKPVAPALALFAALLRVTMAAISGLNSLNHLNALLWLQATVAATGVDAGLLQTLAYHSLRLHASGYHIALVFFGAHCAVLGLLLWRSQLMPRWLGGLLMLAGACYLVNSLTSLAMPGALANIGMLVLLPALVAELSLALWMLFKGADEGRWLQRLEGPQRQR